MALTLQIHIIMTLSSAKQIREEEKSPPPSSPPPLFSVIPGGFIKQLVRETEKESKEARRKKQAVLGSPEREVGGPAGGGARCLSPPFPSWAPPESLAILPQLLPSPLVPVFSLLC